MPNIWHNILCSQSKIIATNANPSHIAAFLQSNDIIGQSSLIRPYTHDSIHCPQHFFRGPLSHDQRVYSSSCAINRKPNHFSLTSGSISKDRALLNSSVSVWKGFYFSRNRKSRWEGFRIYASLDVASAIEVINDLGLDTLTFLAVTVMVIPAFKIIRASPVSPTSVL